jgi:hypothetical protein
MRVLLPVVSPMNRLVQTCVAFLRICLPVESITRAQLAVMPSRATFELVRHLASLHGDQLVIPDVGTASFGRRAVPIPVENFHAVQNPSLHRTRAIIREGVRYEYATLIANLAFRRAGSSFGAVAARVHQSRCGGPYPQSQQR